MGWFGEWAELNAKGFYAGALEAHTLPSLPAQLETHYLVQNQPVAWPCAGEVKVPDWPSALVAGCPGAVDTLLNAYSNLNLLTLFSKTGLLLPPSLPLLVAPSGISQEDPANITLEATPLQMAMLSSTISSGGTLPAPILTLSVNKGDRRVIFTSNRATAVFAPEISRRVSEDLSTPGKSTWESTARIYQNNKVYTWFIGGTTASWQGAPLAVAVVLESDNPAMARQVGLTMLNAVIPTVSN